MRKLPAIFGTAILLFLATGVPRVSAQSLGGCVYVSQTGHNIHGAFWAFYASHNGPEIFGLPITDAFLDKGIVVQIFERAKFEFHPEFPEPYRVQLSLLGLLYRVTDPPIPSRAIPPASNSNYRYFPATGQVISYELLKYYEAHGGWEIYGYPVSDIRFEKNSFVQYFQRARLEWFPLERRVVASPVGEMALAQSANPAQLRARRASDWCDKSFTGTLAPRPVPAVFPPSLPQSAAVAVQVRVKYRQTGVTGPQYVDVVVTDQNGKPLSGMALTALVHLAKEDRGFALLPSDASGRASFSFEIGNEPRTSTTEVEVTAYSGTSKWVGRDTFSH